MRKILILEGVNRVGKSSLARKLESVLNFNVFKDRYVASIENKQHKQTQVLRWNWQKKFFIFGGIHGITQLLPYVSTPIIFDRFHLTEYTYGKVNRGYKIKYFEEIDHRLAELDVKLLLLTDDPQKINARNGKNMKDLIQRMEEAYDKSVLTKASYNYSLGEDEFKNLCRWIEL